MKNLYTRVISFSVLFFFAVSANSQAFKRGSWVLNLSEGWTLANYSTHSTSCVKSAETPTHEGNIIGDRDPLAIEYGISNHWGVGSSWGTDFFYIDPAVFYGFSVPSNKVKVSTSEFTFDSKYHFFVNKRTDLSLVSSIGTFSVAIKGGDKDFSYQYNANGGIIRLGAHARYYVYKRFGVLAMMSLYSASCSPEGLAGNTFGNNHATTISGFAMEFGLCYRIAK